VRVVDALSISHQEERRRMASSSKKKTTMAKINRENAVRERRMLKKARKDARKQATEDGESGLGESAAAGGTVTDHGETGPVAGDMSPGGRRMAPDAGESRTGAKG
jgi:hypothetical protein